MPNSGAPIIVRVGVRIAVRVADLVRIRVWIWIRASPDGSPGRRSGRRPHGPDPNPERIGVWVPIRVHAGVRFRKYTGRSPDPALHHISTLNEESSLLSVDPRRLASPSQSRCLYDYPFVGRPAGCKVTLPRRYVPPSDLVWQWPIQKIVRGKGAWDAVDTSPDIGGQHVLKTFESAIRHNRRPTRTELEREFFVAGFISTYVRKYCLQCFDAVGWAAGRAFGL